jgi:hypothetical protein
VSGGGIQWKEEQREVEEEKSYWDAAASGERKRMAPEEKELSDAWSLCSRRWQG